MRLYRNKKSKENREASFLSNGEETNNIITNLEEGKKEEDEDEKEKESKEGNEEKDEKDKKSLNKMTLLRNENKSLKEVVKDLKKEIIDLKNKNTLNNKGYNLIGTNVNLQKIDENSEKIVEDLMLECNKWKKEYSVMYNENNVLKKYISKLEKNSGVDEQMSNLRTLLAEKDQLLINLTNQLKEYQSKCDDIIIGKSQESKDKQIQRLLNEVKGIRKRILNIVTFNDRITNFDEFIEALKTIKQLESSNKDKNIEKAFDQLTYLMDIYQQNDDKAYSKFVNEIYGEGQNVNNLINFENFNNYNQNENQNQNNNFNINNNNNNYEENNNDNNFDDNENNFNNDNNQDMFDENNNYNNDNNQDDFNNNNNDYNYNNNNNYFDTNMNNNNNNNNNNNMNYNNNNEENNDENMNYNDENEDYNEDNDFGNINFDYFDNNNNEQNNDESNNNENYNNNNNNENNNGNNNGKDDFDDIL